MFGVEPLARIVRNDARIEVKVPAAQGRKAYSYFREGGESEAKKPSGGGKKLALIGGGLALAGLGAAAIAMSRKKPETSSTAMPASEPKKTENNTARNVAIGAGVAGLGVAAKVVTSKKKEAEGIDSDDAKWVEIDRKYPKNLEMVVGSEKFERLEPTLNKIRQGVALTQEDMDSFYAATKFIGFKEAKTARSTIGEGGSKLEVAPKNSDSEYDVYSINLPVKDVEGFSPNDSSVKRIDAFRSLLETGSFQNITVSPRLSSNAYKDRHLFSR